MRHFSDCLQIRFEQESMVCQCPVSAVPVFPASWLLVSPLCLYCQDLHNNTLRVTASQSSCRPMRRPHGQASPATAGLSLVETPGAGGPRAVGECVELARLDTALPGLPGLAKTHSPGQCFTSEELSVSTSAVTCVETQGPIIPIILRHYTRRPLPQKHPVIIIHSDK